MEGGRYAGDCERWTVYLVVHEQSIDPRLHELASPVQLLQEKHAAVSDSAHTGKSLDCCMQVARNVYRISLCADQYPQVQMSS